MTATISATTSLTGQMLIAGTPVRGTGQEVRGFDPAAGQPLEPAYQHGDVTDVDCRLRRRRRGVRPLPRHHLRTARPVPRSDRHQHRGDQRDPDRPCRRRVRPAAGPHHRRGRPHHRTAAAVRLRPARGQLERRPHRHRRSPTARRCRAPTSVSASSRSGPSPCSAHRNFPLAFSVAGGDTASALAAGCPVVVKAHDAHPGTSELVGRAITDAVAASGLPAGTFSLLFGSGPDLGIALVTDPRIKAVGFTGSRSGGTALVAAAAARPEPIPVYAEMSSINPVFVLDGALATRGADLGRAFVGSLTMGSGQFCTNPGLVIAVDGPGLNSFVAAATEALAKAQATPMLTPNIARSYASGVDSLSRGRGPCRSRRRGWQPNLRSGSAVHHRREELPRIRGPAGRGVRRVEPDRALRRRRGSAHRRARPRGSAHRDRACRRLRSRRGGRTAATAGTQGGPNPVRRLADRCRGVATRWCTADRSPRHPIPARTSVGSRAIERYLRPVCYQDVPKSLLPSAIADGNPEKLWRRIDGRLTQD